MLPYLGRDQTMADAHPQIDLMVVSPAGKHFAIDVKGQYKKNFWVISPKGQHSGLYYVLAFVPDDQPNQFFVLTQAEVNCKISRIQKRSKTARIAKGLSIDKVGLFPGLTWGIAERFKDQWNKLPK